MSSSVIPNRAKYDREFLDLSYGWLRDPEIARLTMTPAFSQKEQVAFFESLPQRKDYLIFGLEYDGKKIGAYGLKNIKAESAEYWGYIGDKSYWGKGIGIFMISDMVQLCAELEIQKIWLKVEKENKRAINLYQKSGFVRTTDSDGYFLMEKTVLTHEQALK